MRHYIFCFVLIALELVAMRISLAVLRSVHHWILLYVLSIPIWLSLFVVLVAVARVTFRGAPNGNGQ